MLQTILLKIIIDSTAVISKRLRIHYDEYFPLVHSIIIVVNTLWDNIIDRSRVSPLLNSIDSALKH